MPGIYNAFTNVSFVLVHAWLPFAHRTVGRLLVLDADPRKNKQQGDSLSWDDLWGRCATIACYEAALIGTWLRVVARSHGFGPFRPYQGEYAVREMHQTCSYGTRFFHGATLRREN